MQSKFAYRISVFILAAAGGFAQSTIPPIVVHTTGMIGLAEGQTARFNVLNPGVLPPALGVNCTAVLTFFGPDGGVLKTATVTAGPGQAGYLDLFSQADLNLPVDERKQIRATYTLPAIVPPPTPTPVSTPTAAAPTRSACTLIGTLEILDTLTGKVQAVIGAAHQVPSGPVTAAGTTSTASH